MSNILDRYGITALQKMGWKEEEIALLYPLLLPSLKDFDHDRFRHLTRIESMDSRFEDTYFDLRAERIAYGDAFIEDPFRYCIRICPSMEKAFLKAGARLLPGRQVKFLYGMDHLSVAESITSDRVIDLSPDDLLDTEVLPNRGAWFSVAVFDEMDVYRKAVDIIEQEYGGGHKDVKDPLEYILWLESMVSGHGIHYLFEQWYVDGMRCLGKVMSEDLDLALDKAYLFRQYVTCCDEVDRRGVAIWSPRNFEYEKDVEEVRQIITFNDKAEDWYWKSPDLEGQYGKMRDIMIKTIHACNPVPEGEIPDDVDRLELSAGGITLQAWREADSLMWRDGHGNLLDEFIPCTYDELVCSMVQNYLIREYLEQHRDDIVREMASFTAKVEDMGEDLIDCRGAEPMVKHSVCFFSDMFYIGRLPFITLDPIGNFGLPRFSPSVSSKIFHKE